MLTSAIRDPDPVLFLEPCSYRGIRDMVPDDEHVVPLGKANLVKKGDDVVIISWSWVRLSKRVADSLEKAGISVAVLDLLHCSLDIEAISNRYLWTSGSVRGP